MALLAVPESVALAAWAEAAQLAAQVAGEPQAPQAAVPWQGPRVASPGLPKESAAAGRPLPVERASGRAEAVRQEPADVAALECSVAEYEALTSGLAMKNANRGVVPTTLSRTKRLGHLRTTAAFPRQSSRNSGR